MLWSSYLADLRAALADPAAVFFADTSFLIAVASLHAAAREEVSGWIAGLGPDRFMVPAWVAQEAFRHLSSDATAFTPMKTAVAAVAGRLNDLRAEARRFVDDGVAATYQGAPAGRRDRGSFLIDLDGEVTRLERRLQHLKTMSAKMLDDAADFLSSVINTHLMSSGVYRDLHTLDAEYQARLVGDHPPGYKDKRKESNRFGDLLIWREIAAFCADRSPNTVIICSNDTKPDWAFTPPSMIDDSVGVPVERQQQPNKGQRGFQIVLPQPLLIHELGRNSAGFGLHLLTTQMLSRLSADEGVMPRLVQAYSVLAQVESQPDDALEDGDGTFEPPPSQTSALDLHAAIESLSSFDRAGEALAAIGVALGRGALTRAEARGLGRSIAEAAEVGPETVQLFGRTLLEDPSTGGPQWPALFEGMLLGSYIREDGRPRNRPLGKLLNSLFTAARREQARGGTDRLRGELGSARTKFALLPGEPGSVDLAVVSLGRQMEGTRVGGITLGEVQLLVDGRRQGANTLFSLSGAAFSTTVARFRRLLADYFRVPEESLTLNLASADRVVWDEVQTLVDWGTDTERQLR